LVLHWREKGLNTSAGSWLGKPFREAKNGWFSITMKVSRENPMALVCTFWGEPAEPTSFDIYIDDKLLTHLNIRQWGEKFIKKYYHIPLDYTLGKREVKLTFRSLNGKTAGPVFGCTTVRQATDSH
jgi:hypothetical protein